MTDRHAVGADIAPHLAAPCDDCPDPARCRYVVARSGLTDLGGTEQRANRYRCARPRPRNAPPSGKESTR